MWNIMRAQHYQAKSDNIYILVLIGGLILSFLSVIDSVDEMSGSMYFIVSGSDSVLMLSFIVTIVLVCRICGWDMNDKTLNYEVLSGHKRSEVYFGRVLVSLFYSILSCMALFIIPILVFSIINGFGDKFPLQNVIAHYVLLLFPLLRLACELVLLTFLVNNCYAAMILGWMFFSFSLIGSMILEELSNIDLTFHLVFTNILTLFQFNNYRLVEISGKKVMVFENNLDFSLVIGTIIASVMVGGICLMVGYFLFRKRDLS